MSLISLRRRSATHALDRVMPYVDGPSNREQVLLTLEYLGLRPDQMILMGGAALVLHGIKDRRANDVDVIIPDEVAEEIRKTRQLPNGVPTSPVAEWKPFALSTSRDDLDELNIVRARLTIPLPYILPAEFFLHSHYSNSPWGSVHSELAVVDGYSLQPLEHIARFKSDRPHQNKDTARRDERDAERIRRHLRTAV